MSQQRVEPKPRIHRFLEYLPGFTSWFLIIFPVWGSLIIPEIVAYYIIAFNVYWLYRSISFSSLAIVSYFRIKASKKYDWMADVKGFGDWQKVNHLVILPTYKEPIYIIRRSLEALKKQSFPVKNIHVALAFEMREGSGATLKAEELKSEYGDVFGTFMTTFHPQLPNEVVGKSSNMAWASRKAKKELVDRQGLDLNMLTVTSEDVDVRFHSRYFAALTFKFLDHPERYFRIWQPGILYYNNIWDIPSPVRVFSSVASIVQMGLLNRKDRLINFSTYSTSLKLIDQIGYWDTDVIPEDYRLFFKAYFATDGKVSVDPIFLPAYADAAHAGGFWKTMINQYEQVKRWAWGTADFPWMILQWAKAKKIPFWDKTMRIFKVMEDHFLWPVNWFAITLGATLPPLLNENFARTILGKTLPQTSSTILTVSLIAMLMTIFVDWKQRPQRRNVAFWKKLFMPFEFILLPVVGFFFSALPGLDAHTRLLLGRYIEYRTTEKV